jgi:hypothetical protein
MSGQNSTPGNTSPKKLWFGCAGGGWRFEVFLYPAAVEAPTGARMVKSSPRSAESEKIPTLRFSQCW